MDATSSASKFPTRVIPRHQKRPSGSQVLFVLSGTKLKRFRAKTLFRQARGGLVKIVLTSTVQMVIEGKNLVDVSQNLMSQRLGMTVVQNGNFLSSAALCYMLSGWYCTPFLLRTFNAWARSRYSTASL